MSTLPVAGDGTALIPTDGVARLAPAAARIAPARAEADALDLVAELAALGDAPDGFEENGLGDALLAYVLPRPRDPLTLSQSRIVPLLGAAADLLAKSRALSPDIARLGAAALEQELRTQRALAERRATLVLERADL